MKAQAFFCGLLDIEEKTSRFWAGQKSLYHRAHCNKATRSDEYLSDVEEQ